MKHHPVELMATWKTLQIMEIMPMQCPSSTLHAAGGVEVQGDTRLHRAIALGVQAECFKSQLFSHALCSESHVADNAPLLSLTLQIMRHPVSPPPPPPTPPWERD